MTTHDETEVNPEKSETDSDMEVLQKIIRRATSPMWWARLSYPKNPDFWTENEQRVLAEAGLTGRRSH